MSRHAYVDTFDRFVGQELAKEQLLTAITSAKMRGEPLGHVLLASGEQGIGKSNLAHLIAREMNASMVEVSQTINAGQARLLLSGMQDGDILFYDEIHLAVKGGKANAEWLLTFMQDGMIPGPRRLEPAPAVTLVGATTDVGRLPETVIDRFSLQPTLVPYSDLEGAMIAVTVTARVFPQQLPAPGADSCRAVARAANNNPRRMGHVWERVRDTYLYSGGANHDGTDYDISRALVQLGLTEDGLDSRMQRYILALLAQGGQPVGKTAMADLMHEPGGLSVVERTLQNKGLIDLTKGGRVLSTEGMRRARQLLNETEEVLV